MQGHVLTNYQELDHLTSSYQQLKSAQAKFKGCLNDIDELNANSKGTLPVPLPASHELRFPQ